MNKKFLSKLIIMALTVTTLSTCFYNIKSVNALPKDNNITQEAEQFKFDKENIVNRFKSLLENNKSEEFTIIQEENYKGIINNKTGDIIHEFYNESGDIVDSYSTNFYENIENIENNLEINTYNTIVKNSIPYKLNSQHYTIAVYSGKQKLYAQNARGHSKSYYLKGKYTDSSNAHIKRFINAVDTTASRARLFVNTVGVSGAVALVGYFGIGGKITVAALSAALKALGLGGLIGGAAGIVKLYNNYVDARIQGDHCYNAL